MRPPEPVNRFLYILQMRTADGQLFPVFQDNHAAADFHDLDEILERYRQEMMDGEASLSVAIYEFYSSGAPEAQENLLSKQYAYSVKMWSDFIAYGVERGEFKKTDVRELIDILLFAYQGVRMYSIIMPLDEQIPARIIHHVKRILIETEQRR